MPFEPRKNWYVSLELPKPKLKAAVRRSARQSETFFTEDEARAFAYEKYNEGLIVSAGTLNPICPVERYRHQPFTFGLRKASVTPASKQDVESMQAVSRLSTGVVYFFAALLVVSLMQCVSLLAVEPPSKPFLDKNSFYLSSAGFKVHFTNDAAGKKAMHALPPHRFVIHDLGGGDARYLYAEPHHCMCIFIGTKDAYQGYRSILSQPLPQVDDVSADYETQASALLIGDPVDMFGQPPYAAEYFRNYY